MKVNHDNVHTDKRHVTKTHRQSAKRTTIKLKTRLYFDSVLIKITKLIVYSIM